MNAKMQWGILGTGRIAAVFAAALAQSSTGGLLAVASRSREKAEDFGARFDAPRRYGTYAELLADGGVEAVYISLPNHMHLQWTMRCAAAGKAILCEKPLATNAAEAMVAVEAARRHGVFLMEAFMYRCHPQTARLVRLVRDRAIGELRLIQAHFSYNMGPRYENIRLSNPAAGGGIMDVGCYTVSMCRLLAGAALGTDFADPVAVKGAGHVGAASRVDEWATAVLHFDGDIVANASCGTQVEVDPALRIWGSEGRIIVPNPWFPGRGGEPGLISVRRSDRRRTWNIRVRSDAPLYTVEADVVARHRKKSRQAPPPCMTWADSIGNMRTLDAWRRELGLVFDRELDEALATPLSGETLERRADSAMPCGRVAGVDLPVSRVVMGSMSLAAGDMPFACALLDHYFEHGGNAIDTAYTYGGGTCERAIGRWIELRRLRGRIVIIDKGGHTPLNYPEYVDRQIRESLERLRTDYIDIYFLHRDNPEIPAGEFVDCLNGHREAGRIRAFGGSNWTPGRIDAANRYAASKGIAGFAASSPNFALARWNEPMWSPDCTTARDEGAFSWYLQRKMPVFAWSSQATGFFSGRFKPGGEKKLPASHPARVWFNEGNFRRLERARELARKKGVTATRIALAYVLCQPLDIYSLIGPCTLEESRDSLQAPGLSLSSAELRWLDLES